MYLTSHATAALASSPPLAGERQRGGSGERGESGAPSPPSNQKSDISDFGRLKMPKSGKPDFECKRGREKKEVYASKKFGTAIQSIMAR